MNKENDNAIGRFRSESYDELGDENMCSMPESTGSNEPTSSDNEEEVEGLLLHYSATIATLTAAFFGTIIVSIIVARMWDEDEIKLHILNGLIRLLQTIARVTGGWAIECEQAYNDHVNALH